LFARLLQTPQLHLYSPIRLLQLTLCWPPNWAVAMPRPGPALCCTPPWMHLQFWPCFLPYTLDVLYWLALQQRTLYQIIGLVWLSLLGLAPAYLRDLCCTTLCVVDYHSLCSIEQDFHTVPCRGVTRARSCGKAQATNRKIRGPFLFKM